MDARRALRIANAVVLAGSIVVTLNPEPAIAVPDPPIYSPSYYVDYNGRNHYYDLGVDFGQKVENHQKPQNAVMILDWGGQDTNNSGTWGALSVFGAGTFRTHGTIEDFSEAVAEGYFAGTGTDTTSHLTLLIGTNNSIKDGGTAGTKWANMVDTIAGWVIGSGYGPQVSVAGANDLEVNFGDGGDAHDWASNFSSASPREYYDYGGCAGCIQENPTPWTMAQVWYVAWGASAALPFPEIYNTSHVKGRQWQQLAIYAHREHSDVMNFNASLSQYQACLQAHGTAYACDETTPSHNGTDEQPDDAWIELWKCLNTQCAYDSNDAPNYLNQGIAWSSDIKYAPNPF